MSSDEVPADLLAIVEQILAESGSADAAGFDARAWLAWWLAEPVPALGGRTPSSLLATPEGRELVASTLWRMQSGAYA